MYLQKARLSFSANASAMPLPTLPPKLSDGGTYNFDWRGTPLAQSIYGVAKVAGKGVVVNGDVKGNVYMSLRNVSSDQAMNYLALEDEEGVM